jgi:hypothetical protein
LLESGIGARAGYDFDEISHGVDSFGSLYKWLGTDHGAYVYARVSLLNR